MCNYFGLYFGVFYLDVCCIDGYLWDEDSCYEFGGLFYNGGNIFCLVCNFDKFVDYYVDDMWIGGNVC